MSQRSRRRRSGGGGSFAAIPHALLQSAEYAALSSRAVKLLLDVFGQFNGRNNGDLAAAPSMMRPRGWKSHSMLSGALEELLHRGFLVQTRLGGRNRVALYAVTWICINDCDGKLEARPGNGAPLMLWRSAYSSQVAQYRLISAKPKRTKPNPPAGQSSPPTGQSVPFHVSRFPARGLVAA